ncbi:hypothetical protein JKF63_03865 [Porcisia hertigi]|uniref:Uncharacterized protein n=1 Tax=Porcisia hertigi TaxID=2761500 RepID=A0A836L7F2_9TRYP|nr:hypothetical protein JKF63_03865 [Porcisia hertigi]
MSNQLADVVHHDAPGHASSGNRSPKHLRSPSTGHSKTPSVRGRAAREADPSLGSPSDQLLVVDPPSSATAASTSSSNLLQTQYDTKGRERRSRMKQDVSAPSEVQPASSVEESSFRSNFSENVPASQTEQPIRDHDATEEQRVDHSKSVDGDFSVRWSSPTPPEAVSSRRGEVNADSPLRDDNETSVINDSADVSGAAVAIANAVPQIAQEQNSTTEARANRWIHELQKSTATEDELRQLYQQLERELMTVRRAATTAEATHKREKDFLTRQLEQEKVERLKAEKDREELLAQALTPSHTPRRTGGISPSSVEGEPAKENKAHCVLATNAYGSDVFYDKLKEREERARARVRKEFVRQAQENLYAEQRKSAEAEKAAEVALKRLGKAEEEVRKLQDALQEASSVLEAKDVQLHERAIHVQELETQLRLLEQQLDNAEKMGQVSNRRAAKDLEEAKMLAERRQAELEAQRTFVYQLQEKIGITTRDLYDRENDQESVLRTVQELQTRCRRLEEEFDIEVHEATALLEQRRQRAEDEVKLLQGRNEELRQRCATMGAELEELRALRDHVGNDAAQLRARYEKDLGECHVEIRSLQLQLERVGEVAQRRSSECHALKEIGKQEHEALVRQYAAEARAAQEELSRVKAQRDRESEKHLSIVLELSHQITTLKQENTQLEHAVNVHEHESADATRLLDRTRQELSQLQEMRRRRSAEFETVQQAAALLKNSCTPAGYRYNPHRSQSSSSIQPGDSLAAGDDQIISAPLQSMDLALTSGSGPHRGAGYSLLDLLECTVQQLQSLLHDTHQHGDLSIQQRAPTDSRTVQERQLRPFIDREEREALKRVLESCMAALECCHLHHTSSSFHPGFAHGAQRGATHEETRAPDPERGQALGRDASPSCESTSRAGGGGEEEEEMGNSRSPSWAQPRRQRVYDNRAVAQHMIRPDLCPVQAPQVPLERPRRSPQCESSSCVSNNKSAVCDS